MKMLQFIWYPTTSAVVACVRKSAVRSARQRPLGFGRSLVRGGELRNVTYKKAMAEPPAERPLMPAQPREV